ncbi:hypothetical protein [Croceitalea vernalis]|uniref:Lipocalin-like domain-containing protein n=1 Tax=Croceitalea vernalis TaxID=3075599 RepID=A0ABU3BJD7_9FLAO|nr:hypothetical protein [Croceitalea sp. P007]MDT0622277.1 hypothetical protein [Croceitalea sp. P007]
MKIIKTLVFISLILTLGSCTKEETTDNEFGGNNSQTGRWFLAGINDVDVSGLECYSDSYINITSDIITFFIMDRNEDGSCTTVLDSSEALTIVEDFFYIGDEALEIYIEGSRLTWRVDFETSLIFDKN